MNLSKNNKETSFDKNWDQYAQRILDRKDSPEWEVLRMARVSHWESFFTIKEDEKILDAGCGLGEYTIFSLKKKARVWSFDYSIEMVNCTKALIDKHLLKAESVTANSVTEIPYQDGFFDQVFCLAVLDHLNDDNREKGMRELNRVLRSDGRIVIDVPNRYAYHWRLAFFVMRVLGLYPKGDIHFFTPQEVNKMLSRNGFKITRSLGLTVMPPLSGIYTTDLKRITCLPEFIIKHLDKLYLILEKKMRKIPLFKPICWHYFVEAVKVGSPLFQGSCRFEKKPKGARKEISTWERNGFQRNSRIQ